MRCPKCGLEWNTDSLYCSNCGEDIHIVPDFDPYADESSVSVDLSDIKQNTEQKKKIDIKKTEIKNAGIKFVAAAPDKRTNRIFTAAGLSLLAALLILLMVFTLKDMRRKESLTYQVEQAEKHRMLGEYSQAAGYLNKAIELDPGNVELLEKLGGIHFLQSMTAEYEEDLLTILSHENASEEQIKRAQDSLISLYKKKGQFQEIYNLLIASSDTTLQEEYSQYMSPEPVLELPSGTYEQLQSLRISCEGKGTIYYTTDGTVPYEKSTVYTVPIVLDYGTVTINACLINEYGVKSPMASGTYRIERPLEVPQ